MNQLSLFDFPSMDFYERIQDLLNSLIAEYEFHPILSIYFQTFLLKALTKE